MKIAIIFPRFTGPYGGERLTINLTRELVKFGDSVTIFTHKINKSLKDDAKDLKFIEGFYPNLKNHNLTTILDLFLMPFLIFKMKGNYDLVIPIGWQSTFGAYLYKKIINRKQMVGYYCLEPPRLAYDLKKEYFSKKGALKKLIYLPIVNFLTFIDKLSTQSTDFIISISEWTNNQVYKIYNKKTTIIYPGVETERFNKLSKEEARKKLNIDKKKVFLSVSKLHSRKRLDLAIKLFKERREVNSIFYIIGDGPDRGRIEKIIKKSRINTIKLLGNLSDENVSYYMKASDYFLFTAVNEPFGIAPLEAKFSGCKIIPKDTGYKIMDWKSIAKMHRSEYQNRLKINA